jgi:aerobic-type carbon monoxide dehydrogenase small subunit (CoxS/CutS family)
VKDMHAISLKVNGREHELVVEARRTLADMLRHDLGYTGTHLGCEHGICGACTVILDGAPARACLVFGVQADGAEVRTVEGLADGEQLSDLQQAFSDHHALQCGFCSPGFLMLAEAYLAEDATQPVALTGEGWIYAQAGFVAKGTGLLQRAEKADPGYAVAHFYLGLVADARGETEEAVAQYQAALKNNPNSSGAYNKLGVILEYPATSCSR